MHIYYCLSVVLVLIKLINIELLLKIPEFSLSLSHTNSNYNPNIRLPSFLCVVYCIGFKELVA